MKHLKKCRLLLCGLVCAATWSTAAYAQNTALCNQKLFNTLYNRAPTTEELNRATPLNYVDEMLTNAAFYEHFSRYVNSKMNESVGTREEAEVIYGMLRYYILPREKDWSLLFTDKVDVVGQNINPNTNGLGYFENRYWKKRYAGNEAEGIKLATAYRILNNMIGLELGALTVSATGDSSMNGRRNEPCVNCHFRGPYALDHIASILDRKDRNADANNPQYLPPTGAPRTDIVNTVSPIGNIGELVAALTVAPEFYQNACHLGFQFVFGRPETNIEKDMFDQCIVVFKQSKNIKSTVKHFINSAQFCKM